MACAYRAGVHRAGSGWGRVAGQAAVPHAALPAALQAALTAAPLAALLAVLLLTPGLAHAAASLCKADETVAFSCTVLQRTASLCLQREADQAVSLSFRLGKGRRIERQYTATPQNGQHFSATVSPAMPGAVVRQVWFDQAGSRTLLTECVGSACRQSAGLAMLRAGRVLSHWRCQRGADDAAWFSGQLVKFGADADSSHSTTPLLLIEDIDNPVERLYAPVRR